MNAPMLASLHPWRKLIVVTGLALIFTILFSFAGGLLADALYDVSFFDASAFSNLEDPNVVKAMKLIQAIGAGLGTFIATSLASAFLFGKQINRYLKLDGRLRCLQIITVLLIMATGVPIINIMVEWNNQLSLPEFLSPVESWMRSSEQEAERITKAFVNVTSVHDVIINVLIIAVFPAIGEELLFRGVVQRILSEWFRSEHAGIWISAAVFSAIHVQFFGFVPRMMLGVCFGYMLHWSGSIWLPVIAHFFNNAAAVVSAWYVFNHADGFNPDQLGVEEGGILLVMLSALFVTLLMMHLYSLRKQQARNIADETSVNGNHLQP
jgi:hypothetical protein